MYDISYADRVLNNVYGLQFYCLITFLINSVPKDKIFLVLMIFNLFDDSTGILDPQDAMLDIERLDAPY